MIIDHPDFGPRIEALVGELEQHTEAEIVVVAVCRSGSYQDVRLGLACIVAMLTLLAVVFSPLDFHPLNLPLFMLLLGTLGWWSSGKLPGLLRALTSARRRDAQVLEAARACFVEEVVHGTRGRTGLLVYASELERRIEMVRDLGIDGAVPGAAWNPIALDLDGLGSLETLLRAAGAVLAEHLPASNENPNEIPNAPRVRS